MQVKIHTPSPHKDGFVIEIVAPRSADVLSLFGDDERNVQIVAKSGMFTTTYKLGISDKYQFVRMLNSMLDSAEFRVKRRQRADSAKTVDGSGHCHLCHTDHDDMGNCVCTNGDCQRANQPQEIDRGGHRNNVCRSDAMNYVSH